MDALAAHAGGQEHGAPVEAEEVAQPTGHALDDILVMQRSADDPENLDQAEQAGPLPLEIVDPVLEPLEVGCRRSLGLSHGGGERVWPGRPRPPNMGRDAWTGQAVGQGACRG
jgi:hypothetical protein